MEHKRVTLFAGHYGSGKTNIAVNYALHLAREGKQVAIADLDIVNPYFRTKDSAKVLEQAGVSLISPQFANTNVDRFLSLAYNLLISVSKNSKVLHPSAARPLLFISANQHLAFPPKPLESSLCSPSITATPAFT